MKKLSGKRKYLVIDASVARSAGETEHPVSSSCRNLLIKVLEICHNAVASTELMAEWKRHQSRFTRKWCRSMAARRKPLLRIETEPVDIDLSDFPEKLKNAVSKDIFLIEAALAADQIIITLDKAFYNALGSTPSGTALRNRITWYDPITKTPENLL